ncbi:hypothetical protein CKF54_04870 [Psittacicella hinzii]|uniref:Chromosomal replication initiator protein DnaA ATPAse domain-containing protein n=1 Tax=Psittacicella hinzii TaxID=2028575 RepID=A0A3A1Y551_9GAMM|nr:DnaA/Hda family protein [Psittacicella hinzii]RIY32396.1 hypothetical protein CKF54_04870 [Psittacicella hinzii]
MPLKKQIEELLIQSLLRDLNVEVIENSTFYTIILTNLPRDIFKKDDNLTSTLKIIQELLFYNNDQVRTFAKIIALSSRGKVLERGVVSSKGSLGFSKDISAYQGKNSSIVALNLLVENILSEPSKKTNFAKLNFTADRYYLNSFGSSLNWLESKKVELFSLKKLLKKLKAKFKPQKSEPIYLKGKLFFQPLTKSDFYIQKVKYTGLGSNISQLNANVRRLNNLLLGSSTTSQAVQSRIINFFLNSFNLSKEVTTLNAPLAQHIKTYPINDFLQKAVRFVTDTVLVHEESFFNLDIKVYKDISFKTVNEVFTLENPKLAKTLISIDSPTRVTKEINQSNSRGNIFKPVNTYLDYSSTNRVDFLNKIKGLFVYGATQKSKDFISCQKISLVDTFKNILQLDHLNVSSISFYVANNSKSNLLTLGALSVRYANAIFNYAPIYGLPEFNGRVLKEKEVTNKDISRLALKNLFVAPKPQRNLTSIKVEPSKDNPHIAEEETNLTHALQESSGTKEVTEKDQPELIQVEQKVVKSKKTARKAKSSVNNVKVEQDSTDKIIDSTGDATKVDKVRKKSTASKQEDTLLDNLQGEDNDVNSEVTQTSEISKELTLTSKSKSSRLQKDKNSSKKTTKEEKIVTKVARATKSTKADKPLKIEVKDTTLNTIAKDQVIKLPQSYTAETEVLKEIKSYSTSGYPFSSDNEESKEISNASLSSNNAKITSLDNAEIAEALNATFVKDTVVNNLVSKTEVKANDNNEAKSLMGQALDLASESKQTVTSKKKQKLSYGSQFLLNPFAYDSSILFNEDNYLVEDSDEFVNASSLCIGYRDKLSQTLKSLGKDTKTYVSRYTPQERGQYLEEFDKFLNPLKHKYEKDALISVSNLNAFSIIDEFAKKLLSGEDFQSQVLFLFGKPGVGKTYLMSYFYELLVKHGFERSQFKHYLTNFQRIYAKCLQNNGLDYLTDDIMSNSVTVIDEFSSLKRSTSTRKFVFNLINSLKEFKNKFLIIVSSESYENLFSNEALEDQEMMKLKTYCDECLRVDIELPDANIREHFVLKAIATGKLRPLTEEQIHKIVVASENSDFRSLNGFFNNEVGDQNFEKNLRASFNFMQIKFRCTALQLLTYIARTEEMELDTFLTGRSKKASNLRYIACFILSKHCELVAKDISEIIQLKPQSIRNIILKVEEDLNASPYDRKYYDSLTKVYDYLNDKIDRTLSSTTPNTEGGLELEYPLIIPKNKK